MKKLISDYTTSQLEAARFKPYTGPHGPSVGQIRNNNLALMAWARKAGFDAILILTDFDGAMDEPTECVEFDNGRFTAGYDRWGFVFDGEGDFENADQCGFAEACALIAKELGYS